MEQLKIEDILITVIRKPIKNLYIRVLPPEGRVQMSVPLTVSGDAVSRFAASKLDWIRKHRCRIRSRSPKEPFRYEEGEIHMVWGRPCGLEIRYEKGSQRAFLSGSRLVLQVSPQADAAQREQVLNQWYRCQLGEALPAVIDRCREITGLSASQWRIRRMKTRWGSCNIPEKRIWLNLYLARKPKECLFYVAVHELVHLLEPYHNKRFREWMDRFYPDWRRVKEILNRE